MRRVRRSWGARVAVEGDSMRPTLEAGDWLLADPDAYAHAPPAAGDLVLVPDPRSASRMLVKRVAEVLDGGRELWLTGDAHDGSSDSRTFGSVSASTVEGRPWFRYWPPNRIGRVG
ncbi:MAG: S26 family signal peptidase [Candidatus Limnocylindrales bacterium]